MNPPMIEQICPVCRDKREMEKTTLADNAYNCKVCRTMFYSPWLWGGNMEIFFPRESEQ